MVYNDLHGLFGVWFTEMFVIVGSVILKFHCNIRSSESVQNCINEYAGVMITF